MAEVRLSSLFRSWLFANLAEVWRIASRLVLTPVIIAKLGIEGYGTWALIFSATAYVSMFGVSFTVAYEKFTAEFDQRREYLKLSETLTSGMALLGAFAAPALAAIWVGHPWLLPFLGVPSDLVLEAGFCLLLVSLAILVRMTAGCALGVLAGLQRTDLRYQLRILGSVVDFAVAVPLLYGGFGLEALGWGYLVGESVAIAIAWVMCRWLCPPLAISPWRVSRAGFRTVVSLGLRLQGVSIANTLVRHGLRMFVSAAFGVSMLGAFQLGLRLLQLARTPADGLIGPLMPAFANLEASGESDRRIGLLFGASKSIAIVSLVPLLFAALLADSLLFAWTGEHYAEAVWTLRVLAVGQFAVLLTGVGTASLRAAGTLRLELTATALSATLTLVGAAVGYPIGGYAGIVVALVCAQTLASLWFLIRYAAVRQLSTWEYLRASLVWPSVVLAPAVALVLPLGRALPLLEPHRWTVLLSVAVLGAACVLMCAPLVWFLILSPEDRLTLRGLVPRALRSA